MMQRESPPHEWHWYWDVLHCKKCSNLHSQLIRLVNLDAVERHMLRVVKHVMAEHYPAPTMFCGELICARDKYLMSRHNQSGEYQDDFGNWVPCGTINPKDKKHEVLCFDWKKYQQSKA